MFVLVRQENQTFVVNLFENMIRSIIVDLCASMQLTTDVLDFKVNAYLIQFDAYTNIKEEQTIVLKM